MISHKLAEGDFENLKEFVDSDEVERVQEIIEKMNVTQRAELAIVKDDIYFAFPYDVVITEKLEKSSENQTRRIFAEVLMVFHVLRGLQQLKDSNVDIPMNIGYIIATAPIQREKFDDFFVFSFSTMPEYSKRLWIANYRFRKEFTKGVENEWTVNLIQQIKSIDELEE